VKLPPPLAAVTGWPAVPHNAKSPPALVAPPPATTHASIAYAFASGARAVPAAVSANAMRPDLIVVGMPSSPPFSNNP
jgi:hypothetical protein